MEHFTFRLLLISMLATFANYAPALRAEELIRVLVLDGRNNHDWRNTTRALVATLQATGRFTVDVSTCPADFPKPMPPQPKAKDAVTEAEYDSALKAWKLEKGDYEKAHAPDWENWRPHFSDYAVVVNDYNGPEWPKPVKDAFVDFVRKGGGVVNVHAANNAFSNWADFNAMIGIGWRGEKFGQRVAVDDATGKPVIVASDQEKITGKGFGSGHGSKHAFVVKIRDKQHPIVAGLPVEWLHGRDELYHRMRGSAENLHVIASAFSEAREGGTDLHEPMLWWVPFGQGHVVTTSMGHLWNLDTQLDALYCVGFQTVFVRSVEWAATGKVTVPLPAGFPGVDKESVIEPAKMQWAK